MQEGNNSAYSHADVKLLSLWSQELEAKKG